MSETVIYKICGRSAWENAKTQGRYAGSAADRRDGFIHLSAARQVAETAHKHFSGRGDLVILALSAGALGASLKWEISRNGEKFPHLYGDLPVSAVVAEWDLPLDDGGAHVLPGALA